MTTKAVAAFAVTFALLTTPVLAQQSCAPPLKPMLRVELYFGMGVHGRRPVSEREWERFVAQDLTHRFPGLTVLAARGAWQRDGREMREQSKLVIVVTVDGPATRNAVAEVTEIYKHRFHQSAVGVVTQPVCAVF